MVRKDRSVTIGLRIPEGIVNKIDYKVESTGEYSSRSDFILCAIRNYLEKHDHKLDESSEDFHNNI